MKPPEDRVAKIVAILLLAVMATAAGVVGLAVMLALRAPEDSPARQAVEGFREGFREA